MNPDLEKWSRAVIDSLQELGASALAWDGWESGETSANQPPETPGAFISLVSPSHAIQIGFACSKEASQTIARALLCLDEGEEVGNETVIDAMGEVVNILAGSVKRKMVASDAGLSLGFPIYVDGKVASSRSIDVATTPIKLGEIDGVAIVLCERNAA